MSVPGPSGGQSRCHALLASLLTACAILVIACAGGGGKKGGSSDAPPAKIGEEVTFGDSKWTVLGAEDKGKVLPSRNQFQKDAKTDGKFILVRFKVTNTTNKPERLSITPKLIDSQGREFQQYDHQSFYLPEGLRRWA